MMKKTFLATLLATTSFASVAALPDIDSSNWNANPEDYGMTAAEFINAESQAIIATFIDRNGINEWFHFQGLSTKEDKWVVSPNNDTIYSIVAINVTDGFTLQLPDVGKRFVSTHILDENHMLPFYLYGGGSYKFTADQFESDFVVLGIRMGTDGTAEDVKYIVEQLQPQYKIIGANGDAGITRPDMALMHKVRTVMITEYDKLADTFGVMKEHTSEVSDWEKFTYVTAGAWGLSKDDTAMYAPYAKQGVKGGKCYQATYPAVPVDAFFSITAYNQDKFLMSDEDNIVSSAQGVNLNQDGSFTVHFGGYECAKNAPNFIYTPEDDWSFLMRAYKPDVEAFKTYKMPEIKAVKS